MNGKASVLSGLTSLLRMLDEITYNANQMFQCILLYNNTLEINSGKLEYSGY